MAPIGISRSIQGILLRICVTSHGKGSHNEQHLHHADLPLFFSHLFFQIIKEPPPPPAEDSEVSNTNKPISLMFRTRFCLASLEEVMILLHGRVRTCIEHSRIVEGSWSQGG